MANGVVGTIATTSGSLSSPGSTSGVAGSGGESSLGDADLRSPAGFLTRLTELNDAASELLPAPSLPLCWSVCGALPNGSKLRRLRNDGRPPDVLALVLGVARLDEEEEEKERGVGSCIPPSGAVVDGRRGAGTRETEGRFEPLARGRPTSMARSETIGRRRPRSVRVCHDALARASGLAARHGERPGKDRGWDLQEGRERVEKVLCSRIVARNVARATSTSEPSRASSANHRARSELYFPSSYHQPLPN